MKKLTTPDELVKQTADVLTALGYSAFVNTEKKCIYFRSFGFDAFCDRDKKIVKLILGKFLSEFYYGGSDNQFVYYK